MMPVTSRDNPIYIIDNDEHKSQAKNLAKDLDLPLLSSADTDKYPDAAKMQFNDGQWRIQLPESKTLVSVDFADVRLAARSQSLALNKEYIVRAVLGRKKHQQPLIVLDATAGFGQDSYLLAAAGCEVTLVEHIPLLAYLLQQAVLRAANESSEYNSSAALLNADAAKRMKVINSDSIVLMQHWAAARPDVIYLDPMYAHPTDEQGRGLKKTAAVKKNMAFLQYLTRQQDAGLHGEGMIEAALALAASKVVVKRAPGAQWLGDIKPGSEISGKSARFDIYPTNNK